MSLEISSERVSSGDRINSVEKEIEEIESALRFKLENVLYNEDEDNLPELDCSRLAKIVFNFAGSKALNKAESAYRWVLAGNRYFLQTDHFLGNGACGKVYHGFTYAGSPCAIKVGDVYPEEISYLRQLSTGAPSEKSSINQMIAGNHKSRVMVMELADTNLEKLIESCNLGEKEKLILIRGILSGLTEIQDKGITHADFKSDNIFVMERDEDFAAKYLAGKIGNSVMEKGEYFAAKIGDFGRSVQQGKKFIGGALWFYSPEVFYCFSKGEKLSPDHINKVDTWAAVFVFEELARDLLSLKFQMRFDDYFYARKVISEATPGDDKAYRERMLNYFERMAPLREGLFSDLHPVTPMDKLIQAMSMINPEKRVSPKEALNLFDGLFTRKPPLAFDLDLHEEFELVESDSESETVESDFFSDVDLNEKSESVKSDSESETVGPGSFFDVDLYEKSESAESDSFSDSD